MNCGYLILLIFVILMSFLLFIRFFVITDAKRFQKFTDNFFTVCGVIVYIIIIFSLIKG